MNRVLIVEDDAVARRQLAELFRFEDFEVSEAESGQAGIDAAASVKPDLVVCDIMMPGTDGFGVLDALRRRSDTALTPFIFLTAKAGGRDIRQGMNQGADDYITKPFDPESLIASARQRLARRRAQVEEADRRASDTGMLAAAALPRELEGCLTHLESLADALGAKYDGDTHADSVSLNMKSELSRLRTMSERLKLYGELPSLYARRFSSSDVGRAIGMDRIAGDTAAQTAQQCGREADLRLSLEPVTSPMPEDALSVVVRELVDNACKFSLAGSPVLVETHLERGYVRLVVKDSGKGMSALQIEEIGAFKQFWSGERPPGLGIGLVLVQALVRLHQGEVDIESNPGAGTRVTALLPSE